MKRPRLAFNLPTIVNLAGALVALYLLVVLAKTIKQNYDLNDQVARLQAETTRLQAERDQLSYDIAYYNTNSYRDREARSKLGLQLPGEGVIIIQRPSPTPAPSSNGAQVKTHAPSHFSDWLNFLLGRGQ